MALTSAAFFKAADALPFSDVETLVGAGGLLVVAPHPDDESLGCGGLIAACLDMARPVQVVILSDGTGSHPNSRRYPREALRDLRESEAQAACRALRLPDDALTFLRLPDRSVPQHGEEADIAVAHLVDLAHAVKATAVAVTWRFDPHCDHQAAYALAAAACDHLPGVRLLEYPVWGHTLPLESELPMPPHGGRLDISSSLERKRKAIAAHRSQITSMIDDDPYGFALSPEMIARFERPFEIFLIPEAGAGLL